MINFSEFHTDDALQDKAVGISIQPLIQGNDQHAYATVIESGKKVACHCHHEGDEWYIILSGEGAVFTADVKNGITGSVTETLFKRGSLFRISPDTAHQLYAYSRVELIFLCPPSHLTHDRTGLESLC